MPHPHPNFTLGKVPTGSIYIPGHWCFRGGSPSAEIQAGVLPKDLQGDPTAPLPPPQIMAALEANPTARRTQLQHKFEQVVALMEDNIYECYSEA